jgi:LysR family hydrogen peroxide-inducible transcriptional activator
VWSEDKTAELVARLERGELDAALVAREAELGEVAGLAIARDPFVLALGAGHPLARSARPIAAAELDRVELSLLAEGQGLRDQAIAACGRRVVRAAPFAATSLLTLAQLVASSGGATLLPELALPVEAPRARLHLRRFTRPAPGRTIALVWRKGAASEPAARAVAAALKESYPTAARR